MSDRPSIKEEFLLPTEVIMEILSKLPAMSVLRFHCVSKQWFSILNEYFCNLHSEALLRPGSPLHSYCKIQFSSVQIQQKQTVITFSSPGSTSHRTIKIFSHTNDRDAVSAGALNCMWWPAMQCNGLVGMVPYKKLREQPILVCNPLTREYLALPPCTASNVFFSVALGFAPLSKQYKVVCIHHFVKSPSEQINYPPWAGEVMKVTLGDTTWRVVDPHMDFKPWCFPSSGLYADGKIYWVLWGPYPIKYSILSFDVVSEKGRVVGLPPIAAGGQGLEIELYDFKLVQLDSGVSVFIIQGHVIEVWMLKEYCCCNDGGNFLWNLSQKIKLSDDFVGADFVGAGGRGSFRYRPLGTWESGDDVFVIAVKILSDHEITNRVFYYQMSSFTGRCEPVEFSMDCLPESMSDWYPCYGYKPSLVSLKRYALQEKKSLIASWSHLQIYG